MVSEVAMNIQLVRDIVILLVCIFLLVLLLRKRAKLKEKSEEIIPVGCEGVVRLDTIQIFVSPRWERAGDSLWVDGDICWQDFPMDNYSRPLDKMVRQNLPFVTMDADQERKVDWIKAYTKSGRRYQYQLTAKFEKQPYEKLTVQLERLCRLQ